MKYILDRSYNSEARTEVLRVLMEQLEDYRKQRDGGAGGEVYSMLMGQVRAIKLVAEGLGYTEKEVE